MTDKERSENQLRIERNSIEHQMMSMEERWHKQGKINPLDAVEFDRLSSRYEELAEEIGNLDRQNI